MNLTNYIDEIPNFPKDGILFKDICPLLRSPEAWTFVIQQLGFFCEELQPDYIAGIESRGFIVGSSLSTAEKIPFVPIRKGGKLPGNVIGVDYTLEYGQDRLEVQSNIFKGSKVLLVDDLLATGGTIGTSIILLGLANAKVVGCGFIIELSELNGRSHIKDIPVKSLITYDDA